MWLRRRICRLKVPRRDLQCHSGSRCSGGLVLPDPDDEPSRGGKGAINEPITANVRFQLWIPVGAIRLRIAPVLRTAMPEAAIEEHHHSRPREYHVRTRP